MAQENQKISFIAAIGERTRALGKDGDLMWDIPDDLARFRAITRGHPVIMGRKTWESIPEKNRPMPARANIVVTRTAGYEAPGAIVALSLEEALAAARRADGSEEIFIIGGSYLFNEALPLAEQLYLTLVDDDTEGDVLFPEYAHLFPTKTLDEAHDYNGLNYRYVNLER